MNIIQEFSEQFPKAWSAFVQWCYNNSDFWPVYANVAVFSRKQHLERYLLADMQAWLDSVGIYCDAYRWTGRGFIADVEADGKINECGIFPTRSEALKAAITKGLEIYETQTT